VDASLHIDELVDLRPIRGAIASGFRANTQVHTVELSDAGDAVLLRDGDARLVGRMVAAGKSRATRPAVVLPHGIGLPEAYSAVLVELLTRSQQLANRSSAILQALADADLEGQDLQSIVTLLSRLVGNSVSLKDSNHRVIAWSGDRADLDRARQDTVESGAVPDGVLAVLEDEGVLERIRTERRPFRIESHASVDLWPRVVCPVRCGDVYLGYLSISEGGRRLDAHDFNAAEYGATVVAFHLSRDRAVAESIRNQRALLIYELLFNPTPSSTSRQQAAMLQIDLTQRFAVLTLVVRARDDNDWEHDRWSRTRSAMVATIDGVLERLTTTSAVALAQEDHLLVITPVDTMPLTELATILVRELLAYHTTTVLAVGVSQTRDGSDGLKDSYEEARLAADLGQRLKGPGTVTRYADLGAIRLLSEVPSAASSRHLSETLGDKPKFRDQFQTTYGALVECDYNKAATARRLSIHVNTLKYRMRRIKQATGYDPAEHNGRFTLECTLRLLDLERSKGQG
jgi:sugar diacid utilization regulator